jgi:hypothetical protein
MLSLVSVTARKTAKFEKESFEINILPHESFDERLDFLRMKKENSLR